MEATRPSSVFWDTFVFVGAQLGPSQLQRDWNVSDDVIHRSAQPPARAVTPDTHRLRRRDVTMLEGNHLQQGMVWCSLLGLPRAAGRTNQDI